MFYILRVFSHSILENLFEIKEFIENLLQDIEQLKVCMISRGKEVDYIRKEIRELNELYLKIFRVNGDIHRNICFRLQNSKNKQKGM